MDYKEKYKKLKADIEKAYLFAQTDSTKSVLEHILPELKESGDDEEIVKLADEYYDKVLLKECDMEEKEAHHCRVSYIHGAKAILEKQKVTDEEIIFRPVVGTDIRIAAKQALEKIDIRKKVVLAFNGAYIPVNGKTVGEIDSEYDAWLKKQGSNLVKNGYTNNKDVIEYAGNYSREIWHKLMDNFKNIKDYHIGCNDVSDIVLNAIINTYNWLEKQDKQKHIEKDLEMVNPSDKAEQKPAWSEEDEEMYQNIHECLKNGWKKLPTDLLKCESWFKSLKQRIREEF